MKVLCIVDSYNWALYNRAVALKKHYPAHNFNIKYFGDLDKIDFSDYDIVYSLNWPIHGHIHKKIDTNRKYRLVTSISSHIGQPDDKSFLRLFSNYDGISVSNKILYKSFIRKFKGIKIWYTPFGVDTDIFKKETEPENYNNIFGWVGNASRPVKKFPEIIDIFNSLNSDIKLKVINQGAGLDRIAMNKFYNSIGTLICFSDSEGTPNPILEAAACGRSIISTPVGNVPELVGSNKSIQIVRNKVQLKSAIIRNFKYKDIVKQEGEYLLNEANLSWSWSNQALGFKQFLGL